MNITNKKKMKGQAVLEYILILVALILAVVGATFIPDQGEFSIKEGFSDHFDKSIEKIIGE